jgi:hypothetical protein
VDHLVFDPDAPLQRRSGPARCHSVRRLGYATGFGFDDPLIAEVGSDRGPAGVFRLMSGWQLPLFSGIVYSVLSG